MMKISNNSFSFRRVGLLVKRDVMEHWRTFLNITLILTLLFLVIMYSSTWSLFDKDYLGYCIIVQGFCTKVFSFYSIFVLSGILANMQTQGDRINFLMLPPCTTCHHCPEGKDTLLSGQRDVKSR